MGRTLPLAADSAGRRSPWRRADMSHAERWPCQRSSKRSAAAVEVEASLSAPSGDGPRGAEASGAAAPPSHRGGRVAAVAAPPPLPPPALRCKRSEGAGQ